jgi:hypothetical protein
VSSRNQCRIVVDTGFGNQPISGRQAGRAESHGYRRVGLCGDGYGMSRLVMLPVTRQVPEFRALFAWLCTPAWSGAYPAWHDYEVLRSKSPEAGYLAEVRELIQDSYRLHRNQSGFMQPPGTSCYGLAGEPVGDRLASPGSAIRREGCPARAGSQTVARRDPSPFKVPTWRRSARSQGVSKTRRQSS